jgi:hypothetical protein
MDYSYFSQLADRYFEGQTTLGEEQMLRLFFRQDTLPDDAPQSLRQYAPLFRLADADREQMRLGSEWYDRVEALAKGEEPRKDNEKPVRVKAVTISLSDRLKPLMRAAAAVAIVLTLGNAMRFTMRQAQPQQDDINYADYHDTYNDPNAAYQQASQALLLVTEGLAQLHQQEVDTVSVQQ